MAQESTNRLENETLANTLHVLEKSHNLSANQSFAISETLRAGFQSFNLTGCSGRISGFG
jgi:hypothetical protein